MGERSSPRRGWWDPEGTPAGGGAGGGGGRAGGARRPPAPWLVGPRGYPGWWDRAIFSRQGARLAVRFRGGGGRRLIAGGRGFRKVAEDLAGNFAPDAVKAADLREHRIAMDPFGGAADKARSVGLVCFRCGIRAAFDAGFAVAVQVGDGAGNGAFEADLSEVDAVDGQSEFAGGHGGVMDPGLGAVDAGQFPLIDGDLFD